MDRRAFVQSLAVPVAAAAAETEARKTRLYAMHFFHQRMGDQGARLNDFFRSQLPVIRRAIPGPLGFFTAFVGPHVPAVVMLAGFSGFDAFESARKALSADPDYRKASDERDNGPEPPYDRDDLVLLEATDYSPEIRPLPEKPKVSRIFELRVYHSPTSRQLRLVHERFAGPEIKIFHRVGVHPILYADTLFGPNRPNLTYLTPFASLAERERAWDAFGADPEWIKVRKESIDRGGQIVNQISITLLRPADYSPIQ